MQEIVEIETEIDRYTEQLARSWRLIGTVNVEKIKELIVLRTNIIAQHDNPPCQVCICSPCGCDAEE
jgi:hypothetical protein